MKSKFIYSAVIVLVITFLVSLVGWWALKPDPILVQGEVEATEIKVATKIVGRVVNQLVHEGDEVKKGDLLMELTSPEIMAKMTQAKAAESAASAQREMADEGTRKEQIEGAKNMWLKAQVASELAQKTYDRVNNLYTEGVVAAQKRDEAKAQLDAAVMTEKAALSSYDMSLNGARKQDKMMARAMEERASGAVSEVESYSIEQSLIAPISGEISSIMASTGELVSPGYPVVTIVNLNDIWITFHLREDFLSSIKKGDVLKAKFPALGNDIIDLKITLIKPLGSYATWKATKASGDFDLKSFEVKCVPVTKNERLRPGMTAVVEWND